MTTTPPTLTVRAIDPAHLDRVRSAGTDGFGNTLSSFTASGEGEPLRCCLRYARPTELIALISYAAFDHPSVWREVGPVYVHATRCAGPVATDRLPVGLDRGPRVLRTYREDDTMNYDHITVVLDDIDLAPLVDDLLTRPGVATVHVRTLAPQCFLYAVTRSPRARR